MPRRLATVAMALLLASSCTSAGSPSPLATIAPSTGVTPTATSSPEPTALVDAASLGACDPAVPTRKQTVAFVASGTAWALDPDEGSLTCLFDSGATGPFAWGPLGDRVVLAKGEVVDTEGAHIGDALGLDDPFSWSRPTGRSLVYMLAGATTPTKLVLASGDLSDLRDLPTGTYESLAYHPSGLAMAVSLFDGAVPQIYLATNEGARDKRIVHGVSATAFPTLAFSDAGTELFYVAEHKGGYVQVHRVDLEAGELVDGWRSTSPLRRASDLFLAGGVDEPLAFTASTGGCDGSEAMLGYTDDVRPALRDGSGEPWDGPTHALGFLDASHLLVGAGGCGGPMDLYAVTPRDQQLLITAAEDGASRAMGPSQAAAPLPEDLLGEIQEFG
jgi:hypothetical protein